jgi:hypothetical protein
VDIDFEDVSENYLAEAEAERDTLAHADVPVAVEIL